MSKKFLAIFIAVFLLTVPILQATPVVAQTNNTLDHVVITPSSATIAAGGSQQFSAQGYDANNVAIPGLTYSWAVVAGGGTINATGLFTAGNFTGTYTNTVEAIAVQGSIVKLAFASVKVTAVPGPLHHVVITPSSATIAAGGRRNH